MKIYTKTGDEGKTSLLGGSRVPKHHLRIETYGTVDELNSFLGLLRDQLKDENQVKQIIRIQEQLFTIGSHLATEPGKHNIKLPEVHAEEIDYLEESIDQMNEVLPEMRNFVLPGGHSAVSTCHVARCVCRRAERLTVHLSEEAEVNPLILKYLNRLSDFLFVLSRKITFDTGAIEIPWKPSR
jgi:cob(I)alamin adenosyltransferase